MNTVINLKSLRDKIVGYEIFLQDIFDFVPKIEDFNEDGQLSFEEYGFVNTIFLELDRCRVVYTNQRVRELGRDC